MNWLTNFVRPKIRALVAKPEVPDNLWQKCPSCEAMIFHRDLEANLNVCQHCGHHMRLSAPKRLEMLFDGGSYQTIELPKPPVDPLKFRDTKRYGDRLKEYQGRTGRSDAVMVAHGRMGGRDTVIAAFDFAFMGGSMGMAVGEAADRGGEAGGAAAGAADRRAGLRRRADAGGHPVADADAAHHDRGRAGEGGPGCPMSWC